MNEIQQTLFPCMGLELEHARDRVRGDNALPKAHGEFIARIRAAINKTDGGGVVAVGCSTLADQNQIVDDILNSPLAGGSKPDTSGTPVVQLVMPPLVTSSKDQIRALFDRYGKGMQSLQLKYKHHPLFLSPLAAHPQSRTEAILETMNCHGVKLVCITDAQNMASDAKRITDIERSLRQLSDLSKESGIPHVLIGDLTTLWHAVSNSRLVSRIEFIPQPLYDPEKKPDHVAFVSLLKSYDGFIKGCSNVELSSRYSTIMHRVAGDPHRFASWLEDALCEAARVGCEKLEWCHLRDTAPCQKLLNDANRALATHRSVLEARAFQFSEAPTTAATIEPAASPKREKPKGRRVERNPTRDMVAKVA